MKLIEHFEKGASFDILKARKGVFRKRDHQMLQEMYVVKVKDKARMKDKWDIFDIVEPVPAAGESLEVIQPTEAENPLPHGIAVSVHDVLRFNRRRAAGGAHPP